MSAVEPIASAPSTGNEVNSSAPTYIQPTNYVGFDTITTQIENRLLKRGFALNIMCVGHSGLGKSTLVNTLFSNHLINSSGRKSIYEPVDKTLEIKITSQTLLENNVRLNLNIIDTPGFGDQINNDKSWDPILRYIKDQQNLYLRKELSATREKHIADTRVHCILYFIPPNANVGLKQLDIKILKKLTEIANVVPIIAKADTLTLDERLKLKTILKKQFAHYELKMYPFDNEDELLKNIGFDLTEEEKQLNNDIKSLLPFAVIGSEDIITTKQGDSIRGRRTKWGVINIEDVTQCEFVYLRDFLTRTHLHDLIETTALIHYENFRSKQLTTLRENVGSRNSQFSTIQNASQSQQPHSQQPTQQSQQPLPSQPVNLAQVPSQNFAGIPQYQNR